MCSDCEQNEGLTAKYRTSFDKIEMQNQAVWDDEQYMLCPPRVLGYILRDKQWAQLQVTLVEEIPLQDLGNSWHSRLRLADDDKTKDLLFDLVRSHISSTPKETMDSTDIGLEVDDITPGKGKGLVILLYGTTLFSCPVIIKQNSIMTLVCRTARRRENVNSGNYRRCHPQASLLHQCRRRRH